MTYKAGSLQYYAKKLGKNKQTIKVYLCRAEFNKFLICTNPLTTMSDYNTLNKVEELLRSLIFRNKSTINYITKADYKRMKKVEKEES